ncbi:baseplate wedge subunit protein [Serratia phage Muldoon]|uniref:Baseplate wedge subunit protein n=1 Tax=Serratia phage Muldoon TaxID=2601678 RepID=A0A5P8PHH0_9CAUD|nr:baseplate wedge subunit [Serratia phage Muldoon]QFR56105.1 baseplate wedge subunit protein [Serratia phage Muldoon]WDS61695.1 baseplate wedge subunit [Cronobacter phage vB_Cdu_VP8]
MLFSFFEPRQYGKVQMTDIFRNYGAYFDAALVNFKPRKYFIAGAPRPEELAYILYGNTQLYWVLLMLNNVYDPWNGWITTQETAYQNAIQKYSKVGGDQVLYHVDKKGEKWYNLVQDPDFPGHWYDKGDIDKKYLQYSGTLVPVSTLEDAIRENEKRREIQIIDPSDIDAFLSNMIREMEKA